VIQAIAAHGWNFAPWIAWATVAAAVGTVLAAGATVYLARKTLAMVEAARNDTKASQQIAREAVEQGKRDRFLEAQRQQDREEEQARYISVWTRPGSSTSPNTGMTVSAHYRNGSTAPIHDLHIFLTMSVGDGDEELFTLGPGDAGALSIRIRNRAYPDDKEQAQVEYTFRDAANRRWKCAGGQLARLLDG
jgi:hypothetical protein